MFKFGKKKQSIVPKITKNLPGFGRRSTIVEGQMSARNYTDSFQLVPNAEQYEAGLRSSRHDNSMSFDLGMDNEDYINDEYFKMRDGIDKEQLANIKEAQINSKVISRNTTMPLRRKTMGLGVGMSRTLE